jgi:hypothetical protein
MLNSHDDETRLNNLPLFTKPPDVGEEHRFTTRIVTVCVKGVHNHYAANAKRIALLNRIIEAIAKQLKANPQWQEIDAILLPAGFFSLPHPIGHKSNVKRMRRIQQLHIGQALKAASFSLNQRLRGTALIVGIDSLPLSKHYGGDQFMAAYVNGEITGLARKAFPVDGDSNGLHPCYWVRASDAENPYWLITLRNGAKALLLVCYDAYAVRLCHDKRHYDAKALRYQRAKAFRIKSISLKKRDKMLTRWITQITQEKPNIGLIGIHWFKRASGDGYWQRHGIAGASSALNGAPMIAASHFKKALPRYFNLSSLASINVPLEHLAQGNNRLAHRLKPTDGFTLNKSNKDKPQALIRLFEVEHA